MKNLDLEKIIILLSLVLMPVAGGWIYFLQKDLDTAEVQLRGVDKRIQEIYALQTLIDVTSRELNSKEGAPTDAPLYFQQRFIASRGDNPISADMISVNTRKVTKIGRGTKVSGEDIEVGIDWGKGVRGGLPLTRSFVNAFLFNSEAKTPIWKLRQLRMTNKDFKAGAAPPLEMSDEWLVHTMVFARRTPIEKKEKS